MSFLDEVLGDPLDSGPGQLAGNDPVASILRDGIRPGHVEIVGIVAGDDRRYAVSRDRHDPLGIERVLQLFLETAGVLEEFFRDRIGPADLEVDRFRVLARRRLIAAVSLGVVERLEIRIRSREELEKAHERAECTDQLDGVLTLIDLIEAPDDLGLARQDLGREERAAIRDAEEQQPAPPHLVPPAPSSPHVLPATCIFVNKTSGYEAAHAEAYEMDGLIHAVPVSQFRLECRGGEADVLSPVVPEDPDIPVLRQRQDHLAIIPLEDARGYDIEPTIRARESVVCEPEQIELAGHEPWDVHPDRDGLLGTFPVDPG